MLIIAFLLSIAQAADVPNTPPIPGRSVLYYRDSMGRDWPGVVACKTNGSGVVSCDNSTTATITLPAGAATEAKQEVGNASLASIDTKLTPPLAVSQSGTWSLGRTWLLDFSTDSVDVTGSTVATTQSGAWATGRTWTLLDSTDSITSYQGGAWSVGQSGVWTTGRTWTLSSGTDSVEAVQSGTWDIGDITGTISLPTGAATAAKQDTGNASLSSIDSKLTAPLSVAQSGTWTVQQGTPPWSVSQSGAWTTGRTWNLGFATDFVDVTGSTVAATQSGTWDIGDITGTVSLPTGASTAAKQDTGNASLASIDTKLTAPLSVAQSGTWTVQQGTPPWSVSQSGAWTTGRTWSLLSGTDSVDAVQSGTWNINNISGTVSLPTGAATAANQATANASLASIDSKLTSPVAVSQSGTWTTGRTWDLSFAADQVDVSGSSIAISSSALPSGAATEAKQDTQITSLQILDDVPAAMNDAFSKGAPIMGQFDDTSTTAATEDNVAPARITAQRAVHVNLRDVTGAALGTGTNPLVTSSTQGFLTGNVVYSAQADINQATAGIDNPLLLFRNPTGSGKTLFILEVRVGNTVANVSSEFKLFSMPTITANGTAVTAASNNINGGAGAATGLVTTIPTISANGTAMKSIAAGQNTNSEVFGEAFTTAVQPGGAFLVTGNPLSNNRSAAVSITWAEQ